MGLVKTFQGIWGRDAMSEKNNCVRFLHVWLWDHLYIGFGVDNMFEDTENALLI